MRSRRKSSDIDFRVDYIRVLHGKLLARTRDTFKHFWINPIKITAILIPLVLLFPYNEILYSELSAKDQMKCRYRWWNCSSDRINEIQPWSKAHCLTSLPFFIPPSLWLLPWTNRVFIDQLNISPTLEPRCFTLSRPVSFILPGSIPLPLAV